MKAIRWNPQKELLLQANAERGFVGFQNCMDAITDGRILADIQNPSETYPNQRVMILDINNYAYVVPYVEGESELFLKTVFPSRKYTAFYLMKGNDNE